MVHQIVPRTHVGLVQIGPRLPRRHGVFEPRAYLGLAPDLGRTPLGSHPVMQGEARALAAV